MKRIIALALVVAGISGCTLRSHGVPEAQIPFAKAGFTVHGATNAEDCGTYIFGIDFAHLFDNQGAAMVPVAGGKAGDWLATVFPSTITTPEASRALYASLERMPEATHLLQPRVHTQSSGMGLGPLLLFGERCARVEARGVSISTEPNPQQ